MTRQKKSVLQYFGVTSSLLLHIKVVQCMKVSDLVPVLYVHIELLEDFVLFLNKQIFKNVKGNGN